MTDDSDVSDRARAHAALASEAASKLKPGSWEAVQALATLSIAESLLARSEE